MKVFFDTEFTGLHQQTTLISIGCVADNGREFYAEFTDYDKEQLDEWIRDNVIANLIYYGSGENRQITNGQHTGRCGDRAYVGEELRKWLGGLGNVEMWSDTLAYDWVLFGQLFGHAFNIPKNIYYIPFDVATLFRIKGIDADINREEYSEILTTASEGGTVPMAKHNALWDATVIKKCYEKLMRVNYQVER